MDAETVLLWLLCGGVMFVGFCLTAGYWLARWFCGREAGGRK